MNECDWLSVLSEAATKRSIARGGRGGGPLLLRGGALGRVDDRNSSGF